ncbi:MAG TPA: hypothetical protein VJ860_16615 [Polyangia bacterium]|nr:hypothetical protein [Polyangia bacterium]
MLGARFAAAAEVVSTPAAPGRANVTLLGQNSASGGLREVIAELLAREGFVVSWSERDSFRPQDFLDRKGEKELAAMDVWIDLSSPSEAHLYFRDSQANRFFIRSLPLGQGIDEIGKEEIGHIVASAVLSLSQENGHALTRSEARAALHAQPAQDAVPSAPPAAPRPMRLAIVASGGAQVLARAIPLAGLLVISGAVTRGPRWGRAGGRFGAWLDLGYQIPASYQESAVGVALQSMSLRAGGHWEIERRRAMVFRLGFGGGFDRVDFQPRGDAKMVDLAPGGAFFVPAVCFWGGIDIRLSEHFAVATRALADIALMDVHYDVQSSRGAGTRVLTPFALRPGASLGMAFVF